VRLYLRQSTHEELVKLGRVANSKSALDYVYPRALSSTARKWEDASTSDIRALLLTVTADQANVREALLQSKPEISLRPVVTRRKPMRETLRDYFHGEDGASLLHVMDEFGIHTPAELRASSVKARSALGLPGYLRELTKRPVDGTEDRKLRLLYNAGLRMPQEYLERLHAVYEWVIAKQDARDRQVAIWEPWLQPGRRVTLILSGLIDKKSRETREALRWGEHSVSDIAEEESEANVDDDDNDDEEEVPRHAFLKGTVVAYYPSSSASESSMSASSVSVSSTSSSPTAPPRSIEINYRFAECQVLLDANQFPWFPKSRRPGAKDRKVMFVSESADDKRGVAWRVNQGTLEDTPFSSVSWEARKVEDEKKKKGNETVANYLLGFQSTQARLSIAVPDDLTSNLIQGLAERGAHVLVKREYSTLVFNNRTTSYAEGHILRAIRVAGRTEGLEVWADGHVLQFQSCRIRTPTSPFCVRSIIEDLVATRSDYTTDTQRASVTYSLQLVGSLRATLQRLEAELHKPFHSYQSLIDLVGEMLL
jgi:hypothetical protein